MEKTYKFMLLVGSAALILSGEVIAAGPVAFNGWKVGGTSGGVIQDPSGAALETTCPTGFTCGAAITGDGFFQRQLTNNTTSDSYFQTIITNTGATGTPTSGLLAFADESYVKIGTTGLADSQQVYDAGNYLSITSKVNTGWAFTSGASLDISQSLTDSTGGFVNSFRYQQGTQTTDRSIDMDQRVVLQDNAPTGTGSEDDLQRFALRERAGSFVTSGMVTTDSPFTLPSGATPSSSRSFTATDDVKVIWVGQAMPTMGQSFGFQSYTDRVRNGTTYDPTLDFDTFYGTSNIISYFSTSATGPWNWATSTFGTAPAFP